LATKSLISAALVALLCASAQGGVVTGITVELGTEKSVPFINKFDVTNFDMTGMKVTAFFSDGSSELDSWHLSGPTGIAAGPNFRLTLVGDTFEMDWMLENLNDAKYLTKLVMEGTPGFTVFDLKGLGSTTDGASVTPGTSVVEGTTDSERGYTFEEHNVNIFPDLEVKTKYSNIVRLDAGVAVGDLWTTLTLELSGAAGSPVLGLVGGVGAPFMFRADTDTWGDRTINNPVPEPSSLCLFAGLGLIGAWRCRRVRSRGRAQS
jgi:PEP-CTERM motif